MNVVEVWFGIIVRQAIRSGTICGVQDLTHEIRTFIAACPGSAMRANSWYLRRASSTESGAFDLPGGSTF